MSVDLITGKPGAGKSYEAVTYYVIPALADGRHVVTNLPLNLEELGKMDPDFPSRVHLEHKRAENLRPFVDVKDYEKYGDLKSEKGEGPLYVIDEAQEAVPAGNKNTSREVREWYALHRHWAADVILMTQSTRKLNKEITDLVRYHIQVKKNNALGSSKSYMRYLRDGMNGEAQGTGDLRKYNAKYFKYYQTHTKSAGKEARANEKTIWSHWIFRYVFPLVVIGLVWAFSRVDFDKLGKPSVGKSGSIKAPPANTLVPPVLPSAVPSAPVKRLFSESEDDPYPFKGATFLIAGRIKMGSQQKVFINARTPDGRVSRVDLDDLQAAGYRIVDGSPCFITLNYKMGAKLHRNFANCGQLKDLPPIYYLDPTRAIGGGGNGIGGVFAGGEKTPSGTTPVVASSGARQSTLRKDAFTPSATPNYQVPAQQAVAVQSTASQATPSVPMDLSPKQ